MKFIQFKEKIEDDLFMVYVYNHKGEYLGYIEYKDDWKKHKQHIFVPYKDAISPELFFTEGCLLEIAEKLKELNKRKKDGKIRKC